MAAAATAQASSLPGLTALKLAAVLTPVQVPVALVSLTDADRLWFKSAAGCDCKEGRRLYSFCDQVLAPAKPTLLGCPDTRDDARWVSALCCMKACTA